MSLGPGGVWVGFGWESVRVEVVPLIIVEEEVVDLGEVQ